MSDSDMQELKDLISKYPVMESPINECLWENCLSEFDVCDNPDANKEMIDKCNAKYAKLANSSLEEKFQYIIERKKGSIKGYLEYAKKRVTEGDLYTVALFGH